MVNATSAPAPAPEEALLPIATSTPSPEQVKAALENLRRPFDANQVSKLPKQLSSDKSQAKGNCRSGSNFSADGTYCGGYHGRAIHLDYVGHAALTDRLLETDLLWSWEPLSVDEMGLPMFDRNGGMWINLTVAGVTRLGYGDSQGKTGPNAVKEAIGDALRNAGMRFGAALDLWHKGDLHDAAAQQGQVVTPDGERAEPEEDTPGRDWVKEARESANSEEFVKLWRAAKQLRVDEKTVAKMVAEGTKIKDREEREANAAQAATTAAADQLAGAFQPPAEAEPPAEEPAP